MKDAVMKWLRIVLSPPILICIAVLLLREQMAEGHTAAAILCLGVIPTLSYLVWRAVPTLYRIGRPVQRKLAVAFSVAGYLLGLIFCAACGGSSTEYCIYLCYVFSGVLIAVTSRLGLKSSGHAAGVAGPVMLLAVRRSPWFLLGFGLLIPVWVSSRKLGRHTDRELLLGALYPTAAVLCLMHFFPQ